MKSSSAAGFLFASAALIGACGKSATPPPPTTEIPLAEFCAKIAASECTRLASCGKLDARIDSPTCTDYYTRVVCEPWAREIAQSEAQGNLRYDAVAAKTCETALASAPCGIGFRPNIFGVDACKNLTTGLQTADEACSGAYECAPGLVCTTNAATCPGRCTVPLGNNVPCDGSIPCEDGQFCTAFELRCLASASLGQPCKLALSQNACAAGSYCDRQNPAAPVCRAARGRQHGCNSDEECAKGLRCVRNRCSGGEASDTCANDFDCVDDLRCAPGGVCAKPLSERATCDRDTACGLGLSCVRTGTTALCTNQPRKGETCSSLVAPCFMAWCEDKTCVPSKSDGESCAQATECRPERVCDESVCVPIIARACR